MRQTDRRRATRVAVVAVASLEARGSLNSNDQGIGTVRNLSRTGIGLETGQPPLKGQTVTIRLSLDNELHELNTRATRVDRQGDSHFYRVGLDWSDCSEEQLSFLDQVLGVLADEPSAQ